MLKIILVSFLFFSVHSLDCGDVTTPTKLTDCSERTVSDPTKECCFTKVKIYDDDSEIEQTGCIETTKTDTESQKISYVKTQLNTKNFDRYYIRFLKCASGCNYEKSEYCEEISRGASADVCKGKPSEDYDTTCCFFEMKVEGVDVTRCAEVGNEFDKLEDFIRVGVEENAREGVEIKIDKIDCYNGKTYPSESEAYFGEVRIIGILALGLLLF